MTDQGLDYSWSRPDPAAVYAAGYRFVVRYLTDMSDPSAASKAITAAEAAAARRAGLAIALVWEYRAGDALAGAALGASQARLAVAQAQALGYPAGRTLFFAVDTNTTADAVADYFRALGPIVRGAGYRLGVYAGIRVVSGLFDLGLIDDAWQTYAWSGSPTQWDARAALRQVQNGATVAGASVDINSRVGATYLWEGEQSMGQLAHAFQLQTTGYYCGPAATRVALTARGVTLSQDQLASELGTTVNGTNSAADVVRVMNAHVGAGIYGATYIPGQTATQAEVDAMRAAIVKSIDAGFAVVVNVVGTAKDVDGRSYSYSGGHYVTVTGYSNGGDTLHVDDIAIREYTMTVRALAIWAALRGYAYAANPPAGVAAAVIAPGAPFPLDSPNVYGLITGPNESHGGFYPAERPTIKAIQDRLAALGYANPQNGLFEQSTADAVFNFTGGATGQVDAAVWARLFPAPTPDPVPDPTPTPEPDPTPDPTPTPEPDPAPDGDGDEPASVEVDAAALADALAALLAPQIAAAVAQALTAATPALADAARAGARAALNGATISVPGN